MRSPRQTAAMGASGSGPSSGVSDPAVGGVAGAGSAVGSGAKPLLSGEADRVHGDEVFGDAHAGHRRREVARLVVLPRLPDKRPEPGEDLFVGATLTTGAMPLDTRLGHAHHDLGTPPRPHREDRVVQVGAYPQEMPDPEPPSHLLRGGVAGYGLTLQGLAAHENHRRMLPESTPDNSFSVRPATSAARRAAWRVEGRSPYGMSEP